MDDEVEPTPGRRLSPEAVERTEQLLEVLRDLRQRTVDDGGSAGPKIDAAISEFSMAAHRSRLPATFPPGRVTALRRMPIRELPRRRARGSRGDRPRG